MTLTASLSSAIASSRQIVAATRAFYGEPPPIGMVTFIDRAKVRRTIVRGRQVWGWTFRRAGFVEVGETIEEKLLALQLLPERMPQPSPALGMQHARLIA